MAQHSVLLRKKKNFLRFRGKVSSVSAARFPPFPRQAYEFPPFPWQCIAFPPFPRQASHFPPFPRQCVALSSVSAAMRSLSSVSAAIVSVSSAMHRPFLRFRGKRLRFLRFLRFRVASKHVAYLLPNTLLSKHVASKRVVSTCSRCVQTRSR